MQGKQPVAENSKNPKQDDAKKSSHKSLASIHTLFDHSLACSQCMEEGESPDKVKHWELVPMEHDCSKSILMVKPWAVHQNKWFQVKKRPSNANTGDGFSWFASLVKRETTLSGLLW